MTNETLYKHHFSMINKQIGTISNKLKLTTGELLFIGSFLINFIVGKLIHVTSVEAEIYNYYNDKNNIFNQLFVKQGWFWTTLVMICFYGIIAYSNDNKFKNNKFGFIIKALINYFIATIWWIFFTQWCFGLPIMDKIFIWTGGKCTNIHSLRIKPHLVSLVTKKISDELTDLYESNVITSSVCRSMKGHWIGGHDPSGHVFLLIHSSIYMFFETKDYWKSWKSSIDDLKKLKFEIKNGSLPTIFLKNPSFVVIWLIGLWWFMLLMTNIYFHSIMEKLVGLMFGYAIIGLYVYSRFI